jgi:hypothetical protein
VSLQPLRPRSPAEVSRAAGSCRAICAPCPLADEPWKLCSRGLANGGLPLGRFRLGSLPRRSGEHVDACRPHSHAALRFHLVRLQFGLRGGRRFFGGFSLDGKLVQGELLIGRFSGLFACLCGWLGGFLYYGGRLGGARLRSGILHRGKYRQCDQRYQDHRQDQPVCPQALQCRTSIGDPRSLQLPA